MLLTVKNHIISLQSPIMMYSKLTSWCITACFQYVVMFILSLKTFPVLLVDTFFTLFSASTLVGGCTTFFPTINVTFVNPLYYHLCQLQPLWGRFSFMGVGATLLVWPGKEKSDKWLCCSHTTHLFHQMLLVTYVTLLMLTFDLISHARCAHQDYPVMWLSNQKRLPFTLT